MSKRKIESLYASLGDEIRKARTKAGLTQAELAKKVKLNRTTITNFELGRHRLSLKNIEAIARALGLVLKLKLARK